jgi:adenylate cyclase
VTRKATEEVWREILTGQVSGLRFLQGVYKRLPASPRCKLCFAPFGRPGNVVVRLFGGRPSPLNRRLCTSCMRGAHKHPGGAEVEITVLFADVRGSTGLAERTSAVEFGQLLARFYGVAARVVDDHDGVVDKFVGDEAVALFIPGFAGKDHAARAVAAARELLRATGHEDGEPWIPVGIGIHTGVSFVGYVGEGDAVDFTALGDTVNIAARLRSEAGVGQLFLSDAVARAAGLDTSGLEHRELELRGRTERIEAWLDPASEAFVSVAVR